MKSRLILIAGLVIAARAQAVPVTGVIVNALSGSPMKRVRIILGASQPRSAPSFIVTADDGRFSFDVPPGKYSLAAEYAGVRQAYGLAGPGLGFGVSIITGADQNPGPLTFRW